MWAMVAPASKASWADSICSSAVIGTAGLCSLRGTEPQRATVMIQGLVIYGLLFLLGFLYTIHKTFMEIENFRYDIIDAKIISYRWRGF